MALYVTNGFRLVDESRFFGKVNGIEVDNVYSERVFRRAANEINEKKIEYYVSNDYDLSILKQCPTIKYICISGEATLNDLIGLDNITGIAIGGIVGENESFDFCRLPHVNALDLYADGKNRTWVKMDWLKRLSATLYFDKDLKPLRLMKGLESLSFDLGRMKTLEGIENFPLLKSLDLDYCRKIKSVKELSCLKNLEKLRISDCNMEEDFEKELSELKTLKELTLLNLETTTPSHLDNLDFIKEMPSLQSFETNYTIRSRDLRPLLKLENAEIYEDKRGYNLKDKDLPKWDKSSRTVK